ncbi:MAG: hypothetical protein HXY43_18815 [Fischerella sp.]|uniref:hypothetical protein n=1 Tax=Fischerella sp. TaxID=1191 RepID=UPI001826D944|nr:hypothetical protein [Fischerella sp.]NWF61245.1 hypothetical protein [Fischerella sp.]
MPVATTQRQVLPAEAAARLQVGEAQGRLRSPFLLPPLVFPIPIAPCPLPIAHCPMPFAQFPIPCNALYQD